MIKQELLNKKLQWYVDEGKPLIETKYNAKIIPKLFEKFSHYGMVENDYCCAGETHCCWQEVIEEGNWDLTLSNVKKDILHAIHNTKKYLYNDESRFYIYQDDKIAYIFIYCRDTKLKCDYNIWFSNTK